MALVDSLGKELVEQVTVGRMDLEAVIACLLHAARRRHKILLNRANLIDRQGPDEVARIGVDPVGGADWLHAEHRSAKQAASMA